MLDKLITLLCIFAYPTLITLQVLVCFKQWELTKSGYWLVILAPMIVGMALSLYKACYEYRKEFLEKK